jgi:hypothetical protein
MTGTHFVIIAIATGVILGAAWNIVQSYRIDRLQRRIRVLEQEWSHAKPTPDVPHTSPIDSGVLVADAVGSAVD